MNKDIMPFYAFREQRRSMDINITAAIIDTNVIMENQSDFMGLRSSTLPSFYDLLLEKGIILLDHDILHKEIKKHISDSSLVEKINKLLESYEKSASLLESLNIDDISFFAGLKKLNLVGKIEERFDEIYKTALVLPYSDPEKIFNDYFLHVPPFAESGKKKSEFPDAFVIDAIKNYLREDGFRTLMVISNDRDWEEALKDVANVVLVSSIDEGIKVLQNEQGIIEKIINICKKRLVEEIEFAAECECYEIDGYELEEDLEIESLVVDFLYYDIVPLKITNSKIVFKCSTQLVVAGKAIVFDENLSVWSSEDREYIYRATSKVDFEDARADAICEIEIDFDLNDLENSIDIIRVKIVNNWNIEIRLNSQKTNWEMLHEEDDFYDF